MSQKPRHTGEVAAQPTERGIPFQMSPLTHCRGSSPKVRAYGRHKIICGKRFFILPYE